MFLLTYPQKLYLLKARTAPCGGNKGQRRWRGLPHMDYKIIENHSVSVVYRKTGPTD
jgi:hypothetical protein